MGGKLAHRARGLPLPPGRRRGCGKAASQMASGGIEMFPGVGAEPFTQFEAFATDAQHEGRRRGRVEERMHMEYRLRWQGMGADRSAT